MSDISKCEGKGCPLKDTCFRYTVQADPEYQSYIKEPYDPQTDACDFYTMKSDVGRFDLPDLV